MGSIQAPTADQGLGETLLDGDDVESLPEDVAPDEPRFELPPCDPRAVAELCETLDLNPLVAQTLVRRGIADRQSAMEFLDGGELEAAERLPGALAVAGKIAKHVRAGSRIAVHGDYDVDGVCSTAILVRTLDRLGAQVTWHVPSRFNEGYGLSASAIERLAADGAGLIVAVDCGVTAVAETELTRSLGADVAICDHHTPGETLPDAPIAHPALGEYVCPQLCAAAVTFKVCQVLAGELGTDPAILDDELALVALATVCDVVPL
ncbi:MAG: DHH family phosphoesterase, partial [Thermoleophilia bacterium]|nr:DHH family phosphoesterase [Thermoleophilia bacterium]